MKKLLLGLIIFGIISCAKHDTVRKQSINGMVFNDCTDQGLENTKVFLEVFKNNTSLVEKFETVSDEKGNFSFSDIGIHSSADYNYAITIPSLSGIGTGASGFNGTTLYFEGNESEMFFKPRVVPKFLYFCMDFAPNTVFNDNDSINVHIQQKIFHKNIPNLPYESTIGDYGIRVPDCSNNYPMGLWNITINKWKNNVHSVVEDSVFLGFAETKTYIVNW